MLPFIFIAMYTEKIQPDESGNDLKVKVFALLGAMNDVHETYTFTGIDFVTPQRTQAAAIV